MCSHVCRVHVRGRRDVANRKVDDTIEAARSIHTNLCNVRTNATSLLKQVSIITTNITYASCIRMCIESEAVQIESRSLIERCRPSCQNNEKEPDYYHFAYVVVYTFLF